MADSSLVEKYHVDQWCEKHKDSFDPPVCNKLMHKKQLTVMFVGGPNSREDFHIEEGGEFFYQMKGNMELPTVQAGKRKLVKISEGEVFLLPSRIPHSPQRPEKGSLGLVVERERDKSELDCLRYYVDFATCNDVLWESYFHCSDLGTDLVPQVKAYQASEEFKTRKPTSTSVCANPPFEQDTKTVVPDPFNLKNWIQSHQEQLNQGLALDLFQNHPDTEFSIQVVGGGKTFDLPALTVETVFFQLKGKITITEQGSQSSTTQLLERECSILKPGTKVTVEREPESIGLVISQSPKGASRELSS
eukprot:CAMPEP_0201497392 /NCGR_PEP_ID=MMETSP0151_2-20130828/65349_1 /ASSEMBLY_ACC=CAM_ASM_000257 /TAXON_ID=200890 /ORGANISM="Paramoeba atlantica, Strain 621/1 / CCAP 1560/9" /LENGTH=303 /DNA_ID=CAMNT_0047888045 /DNA_START=44 /DNA_END=955 /DNA_ORIENTATION=-